MAVEGTTPPEGANGGGAPGGGAGGVAPGSVPTGGTPTGTPTQQTIEVEKLAPRFAEEREKARGKLLKELGFDKVDDLKAVLTSARDLQDKQLTEQQRLAKTIDELKPRAERAASLEARLGALATRELGALPEATRAVVTKHAGEDPEKILATIEMFRESGLLAAAAAPTQQQDPAPKPPATTAAPNNAPKPGATRTKFDEWNALSGVQRDIFYGIHRAEIEKTRPAGQ